MLLHYCVPSPPPLHSRVQPPPPRPGRRAGGPPKHDTRPRPVPPYQPGFPLQATPYSIVPPRVQKHVLSPFVFRCHPERSEGSLFSRRAQGTRQREPRAMQITSSNHKVNVIMLSRGTFPAPLRTHHGSRSVDGEAGEPRIPEECRQNPPSSHRPARLHLALLAFPLDRAQAPIRPPDRNAHLHQIARSRANLSSNRPIQLDVTLLHPQSNRHDSPSTAQSPTPPIRNHRNSHKTNTRDPNQSPTFRHFAQHEPQFTNHE